MEKIVLILILIFSSVSPVHSFEEEPVIFNANQIIKFEISVVPRNVDIYVDLNGDGKPDQVFISPIIESYPKKTSVVCTKDEEDCDLFVEMVDFFKLETQDDYQPYIYMVSKSYILHRKVGLSERQEFILAKEPFEPSIKNKTNGFIKEEFELKNSSDSFYFNSLSSEQIKELPNGQLFNDRSK